jgi:hypothetical protein
MAVGGRVVVVVVVVLTQIGAVLTTWMALGLARVNLSTVVARDVELCWSPWAWLMVVESLSFGVAGYRAQLMGRLRSDSEEFCKAFGDIGDEDGLSPLRPLLFK